MDLGVYLVNMVLRESVSRFFHPFRPEISILVSVKCVQRKKGKRRFRIYHFQRLLLTFHSSYRIEFQYHEFICDATPRSVKHGEHTEAIRNTVSGSEGTSIYICL